MCILHRSIRDKRAELFIHTLVDLVFFYKDIHAEDGSVRLGRLCVQLLICGCLSDRNEMLRSIAPLP